MSERKFTFTETHFLTMQDKKNGYAFAPLGVGGPCLFSDNGNVYFSPDMANWRIVTEADFPIEVAHD